MKSDIQYNGYVALTRITLALTEVDKVAGILRMPSAESQVTMEVVEGFGHGTWNVPATLAFSAVSL